MRPLLRLEAEPESGAIFGRLFLAEAPMAFDAVLPFSMTMLLC
jgi:hypothetical protein